MPFRFDEIVSDVPRPSTLLLIVGAPIACVGLFAICQSATSSSEQMMSARDEVPAGSSVGPSSPTPISWAVPGSWKAVSRARGREAAYLVARAPGDLAEAEVSVVRSSGTLDDNIQRCLAQVGESGNVALGAEIVHGLHTATVEAHGTYVGSGAPGETLPAPQSGFALVSTIVEAGGTSYVFELVGPAKTVAAAKPAFQAMTETIEIP